MSTQRTSGWLITATGSPASLARIADELVGSGDLRVSIQGNSLLMISETVNRIDNQTDAEWTAYEFVRLLSAAAFLRFGVRVSAEFHSVQPLTNQVVAWQDVRMNGEPAPLRVSISQILTAAQQRKNVRIALLGWATGGAEGLFNAYESLCAELMFTADLNYAAGLGTREWLIQRKWLTERQEQTFLATLVAYRNESRTSPGQALRR